MSIGDDLSRAVDTCLGPRSIRNTSVEARRLLNLYGKRAADPDQRHRMDQALADAELGTAAYLLGVHYQVQGRSEQAQHWLRVAAAHDVADAAARLAMLYEYRSVIAANTSLDSLPTVDDDLAAARHWYQVAARAGYQPDGDRHLTNPTPLTLDCCPTIKEAAGTEAAEEIVAAARRQADALLRQARADVRVIVDASRKEVDDLARQRAEIEEQMRLLSQVVTAIAATETQPLPRRWRRSRSTDPAVNGEIDGEAWQRMRDHFRRHAAGPRRRTVFRSLITRLMTLLTISETTDLDTLDFDVESKEAVVPRPVSWTSSDRSMRARAG